MLPHFLNYRELDKYERVFVCMSHPVSWEIIHKLYLEKPWSIGGAFGENKTPCGTTLGIPFYEIADASTILTDKDVVIVFHGDEIRALENSTKATLLHGELLPIVITSNELAGFMWFVNSYQPEGVCLDVGANWGINTGVIADKAEAVYAFEPLEKLHSEGALFKFSAGRPDVHLIKSAVGSFTGEIQLRTFANHGQEHYNSTIVNDTQVDSYALTTINFGESHSVPIISIDEFCQEKNIKPSFIKVDVEGAESTVLKGAREPIKKYKPVLYLEMPTGMFKTTKDWDKELALLDELYDTISVPDITDRALPGFHKGMSRQQFYEKYDYNTMNCGFVPKVEK